MTVPAEPQIEVDAAHAAACYANFWRVSGTPEEVLLDFGLNPQFGAGQPARPIAVERVVIGWHTAKRLLQVLQMSVARHEAAFGPLETDVQKRVVRRS